MKIYHNPRCRKSRETLALIRNAGTEPEVVLYLENPPSVEELSDLLKLLGIQAQQLLRKGEKIFKENFKGQEYSDTEWVEIMVKHPKLIERPIVVKDGKAVLGRPPENVEALL